MKKKLFTTFLCFAACMCSFLVSCTVEVEDDEVKDKKKTPTTEATYTITYHGNNSTDGNVPVDSKKYKTGEKIKVADPANSFLERTDYSFTSWNTKADGSGYTNLPGSEITVNTENISLYAKWSAIVPDVPTGLSATVLSASTIQLSWTAVSKATYYTIYKYYDIIDAYVEILSTTAKSVKISGLTPSTYYSFKITAQNSVKSSEYSSVVSATTTSDVIPTGSVNLLFESTYSGDILRYINFYSYGTTDSPITYTPVSGYSWPNNTNVILTGIPVGKYEIEIIVYNTSEHKTYYYYTSGESGSMTWTVNITSGCVLKYKYNSTRILSY